MKHPSSHINLDSFILAGYLTSPLIYAVPVLRDLEFILGTYYVTVLNFVFLTALLLTKRLRLTFGTVHLATLFIIGYVFVSMLLYGTISVAHFRPILFFLNLLIALTVCSNIQVPDDFHKTVVGCFAVQTVICIILLVPPLNQLTFDWEGRFLGYSFSATTFSTFYLFSSILALSQLRKKQHQLLLLVIALAIMFLSKTRTNIMFLLLAGGIIIFPFKSRYSMSGLKYSILLASCMLVYLLSDYALIIFSFFLDRYAGQKDYSTMTRLALLGNSVEIFLNSSPLKKLFGNGPEYLRFRIMYLVGKDLKAHFDFIMFLIDYGIFLFVFIFGYFKKYFTFSKYLALLLFAYFMSFYHNMAYDSILIAILAASRYILASGQAVAAGEGQQEIKVSTNGL